MTLTPCFPLRFYFTKLLILRLLTALTRDNLIDTGDWFVDLRSVHEADVTHPSSGLSRPRPLLKSRRASSFDWQCIFYVFDPLVSASNGRIHELAGPY